MLKEPKIQKIENPTSACQTTVPSPLDSTDSGTPICINGTLIFISDIQIFNAEMIFITEMLIFITEMAEMLILYC
jgi:hypothetical protein